MGRQEIAGVTGKFGLGVHNETEQRLRVLSREHTGYRKHPFPPIQEMTLCMDITRCNQIDYILCSQRWRSSIQSAKTRPDLTMAQIMSSIRGKIQT